LVSASQTMEAFITGSVLTATAHAGQALTPLPSATRPTQTLALPTLTPTIWTVPPLPSSTATRRPPASPTSTPPSRCDWAAMIANVTVPDGADFAPSAAFVKTWRLKNIGTCTWTTSYSLLFSSGERMNGASPTNLPVSVAPGQTIDLSLNMTAPAIPNNYRGYWLLRNAAGQTFGVGSTASSAFWVDIDVFAHLPLSYDFIASMCQAAWTSGAGTLPCPGTDGDGRGFVYRSDPPLLENGVPDNEPALLTFPQNVNNGYISGKYPAYTVQANDHLFAVIGCQYGATACDVVFRIDYQPAGSSTVQTLGLWQEVYDRTYRRVDIDLTPLAGQSIHFILTVQANGSPSQDIALWLSPAIDAVIPAPTPTPTYTPTDTPVPPTPTETPTPTVEP
ncbi:MAG: hypothetical protein FJZ96_10855, partial [Chloroflexi bacterium]|nr:hypothetical protein [Chloroflexota bacterium]